MAMSINPVQRFDRRGARRPMARSGGQKAVSNRPVSPHIAPMGWPTFIIFVLGIGNFALGRAIFASRHPMFARLPQSSQTLARRASLATEFVVLYFALLLSVQGWPAFAWAYFGYSALNGVAGWLILTRRV
jgi:hypothetical protein